MRSHIPAKEMITCDRCKTTAQKGTPDSAGWREVVWWAIGEGRSGPVESHDLCLSCAEALRERVRG